MAISLSKGQRVDLTKGTGLRKIMIGLGWDTNRYRGRNDFDLDAGRNAHHQELDRAVLHDV